MGEGDFTESERTNSLNRLELLFFRVFSFLVGRGVQLYTSVCTRSCQVMTWLVSSLEVRLISTDTRVAYYGMG